MVVVEVKIRLRRMCGGQEMGGGARESEKMALRWQRQVKKGKKAMAALAFLSRSFFPGLHAFSLLCVSGVCVSVNFVGQTDA